MVNLMTKCSEDEYGSDSSLQCSEGSECTVHSEHYTVHCSRRSLTLEEFSQGDPPFTTKDECDEFSKTKEECPWMEDEYSDKVECSSDGEFSSDGECAVLRVDVRSLEDDSSLEDDCSEEADCTETAGCPGDPECRDESPGPGDAAGRGGPKERDYSALLAWRKRKM